MTEPLAYFITWTVYGTWLPGDERGWRRYRGGFEASQSLLSDWNQNRLLHPVILLNTAHRQTIRETIEAHCQLRGWKEWASNPRTNHVHCVITAKDSNGASVRDQLKAYCTRAIRLIDVRFAERPIWSRGGDWKTINTDDGLNKVILYVNEAQGD